MLKIFVYVSGPGARRAANASGALRPFPRQSAQRTCGSEPAKNRGRGQASSIPRGSRYLMIQECGLEHHYIYIDI